MEEVKQKFRGQIVKGNNKFSKGKEVTAEYVEHVKHFNYLDHKGRSRTKKIVEKVSNHKINGHKQKFVIHKPSKNIVLLN